MLPGFPGFIDPSDGVYREWQKGGLCGMHAYRTVGYALKKRLITDEKYKEQVPGLGTFATDLVDLADMDGLDAKEHFPAQFNGAEIDNIKAFIIILKRPSPLKPHGVAMVRTKKGFRLSDSEDQDKAIREIYSDTATEAFIEYQRRNKFTAHSVISFHERVPAYPGKRLSDPFTVVPIEGTSERGGHEVLR